MPIYLPTPPHRSGKHMAKAVIYDYERECRDIQIKGLNTTFGANLHGECETD